MAENLYLDETSAILYRVSCVDRAEPDVMLRELVLARTRIEAVEAAIRNLPGIVERIRTERFATFLELSNGSGRSESARSMKEIWFRTHGSTPELRCVSTPGPRRYPTPLILVRT